MPARTQDERLSPQSIAAVVAHPNFRSAVERFAAADLDRYRGLSTVERWILSDVGRASLSGAAMVLDGLGQLTVTALMTSRPVTTGEVSRGRARLYLQRAMSNRLIVRADETIRAARDASLALTPRFRAVMTGVLELALRCAPRLTPDARPGLERLSDVAYMRRFSAQVGALLVQQDLFPLDAPVRLFQTRDGGSRMLAALILAQPPDRQRLLEGCTVSHSALARAGVCSRAHVIQVLRDGATRGLLSVLRNRVTFSRELSDDVERYYASFFTVVGIAAAAALAELPIAALKTNHHGSRWQAP